MNMLQGIRQGDDGGYLRPSHVGEILRDRNESTHILQPRWHPQENLGRNLLRAPQRLPLAWLLPERSFGEKVSGLAKEMGSKEQCLAKGQPLIGQFAWT